MDWEKEANAERKRRSAGASRVYQTAKPVGKPTKRPPVSRVDTGRKPKGKPIKPPRRIPKPYEGKTIPSKHPVSKLKIKEYDRFRVHDEEEYDEEFEEFAEEWQEFENDYPELDDLDNIEDFLEDIEHEEEGKYREPA
jgi:hypothetical protein